MKVNVTPHRVLIASTLAACLVAGLMVVGIFVGVWVTQNSFAHPTSDTASPLQLMADSASRGKNVSMATGLVDDGNEGLYILDHLNGNLQCWVLNTRTNEVGGIYRTNVLEALPGIKAGGDLDFVLTTGYFDFNNRGNQVPAKSIAYVAEGKSGAVIGFSFQFDKTAIQRGMVQEGVLEIVCKGPIRELQLREQ